MLSSPLVHVDNAGNENAGRSFENSDVDDGRHKGVRWDMVAIGVGVVVLLLVVLAISGVVTYAYSNSHKDRQRRYTGCTGLILSLWFFKLHFAPVIYNVLYYVMVIIEPLRFCPGPAFAIDVCEILISYQHD